MKWVLSGVIALVIVVVVAIGVWYSIGGREFEFSRKVVINAPARKIFAELTNPAVQGQWVSGVQRVEAITKGEMKLGFESKIVVEENGKTIELKNKVIEFKSNRLLVIELVSEDFTIVNRFELEPKQGKPSTTVVQTLTGSFNGSARFAAPFAASIFEGKMDEDLARLKTGMEQQQEMDRLTRPKRR